MSARRRARLRRTVAVLTLLVVASGSAAYAVWHDAPSRAEQGVGSTPEPGGPAGTTKATAPATGPAPTASAGTDPGGQGPSTGFAEVVTDRIPAPTTSISIDAPVPGTTNMQPGAAAAFKAAFAGAEAAGLSPQIKSAWRSERYQQLLFDRAVTRYGSRSEAAKWVLPPLQSAHVKGYAIDVRPEDAAAWLEDNGARYGVCRAYDNEWWHFEYVASTTCPPRKPDAAG